MAELERRFASGVGGLDVLAKEINAEHRAFVGTLQKTAEHGIRAGELLADAKASCPHGTWLPWLEKSFEGSVRTAQEYMRLYNHRDEIRAKTRDSAHLSVSGALKELSASEETKPGKSTTLAEQEAKVEDALSKARRGSLGIAESFVAIHRGRGWVHGGHASFADYVTAKFDTTERAFPIPFFVISDDNGQPLPVFEMAEAIHAWAMVRVMDPLLREASTAG